MEEHRALDLADTLVGVARELLGVAVRTVGQGPVDITVVQHRVLVLLSEEGTLSVTDVAESLGVDQSNGSRVCQRLEKLGLIARSRAAHDGRAVDVALTAAGRRQVAAVHAARCQAVAEILATMSDDDAQAV